MRSRLMSDRRGSFYFYFCPIESPHIVFSFKMAAPTSNFQVNYGGPFIGFVISTLFVA